MDEGCGILGMENMLVRNASGCYVGTWESLLKIPRNDMCFCVVNYWRCLAARPFEHVLPLVPPCISAEEKLQQQFHIVWYGVR